MAIKVSLRKAAIFGRREGRENFSSMKKAHQIFKQFPQEMQDKILEKQREGLRKDQGN